ncbi:Dynein Heavy Chain 6, Axonemal [Manis pentadactyla]|nr:Dynein Heavy Chain 6, Axonemal [Manis pentadactyla]
MTRPLFQGREITLMSACQVPSSHPAFSGETEAKNNDHLEPRSSIPSLGHGTFLSALATPEQNPRRSPQGLSPGDPVPPVVVPRQSSWRL